MSRYNELIAEGFHGDKTRIALLPDDKRARELMRQADADLHPIAGRYWRLTGTLPFLFYGVGVVAGTEGPHTVQLIVPKGEIVYE